MCKYGRPKSFIDAYQLSTIRDALYLGGMYCTRVLQNDIIISNINYNIFIWFVWFYLSLNDFVFLHSPYICTCFASSSYRLFLPRKVKNYISSTITNNEKYKSMLVIIITIIILLSVPNSCYSPFPLNVKRFSLPLRAPLF